MIIFICTETSHNNLTKCVSEKKIVSPYISKQKPCKIKKKKFITYPSARNDRLQHIIII